METEILKAAGQVAGIGGLALAVLLLLFRELIRKSFFPNLTKAQAYRLLSGVVVATSVVAVVGIGAWVWVETNPAPAPAVGAGRDISARDIDVTRSSAPEPRAGGVEAGRDIQARDIEVKED